MKKYYEMLSKRLSIRKKVDGLNITSDDLDKVKKVIEQSKYLYDYKLEWEIVDIKETNSKIGEYAICIYSDVDNENKYLVNIGYIFEQVDLLLEENNIGVCWLGIPRPNKKELNGLKYAIMLGLTKINEDSLRKETSDFKRKDYLWDGDFDEDVIKMSMLAPSACNSQPWNVIYKDNIITVYRNKKVKTIIPRSFIKYYNNIDMGIYLCFLESCLDYKNYKYERKLYSEELDDNNYIKIAEYYLK